MTFNSAGDLFVSDQDNGTIVKITSDGVQSNFASGLSIPAGLAFNSAGRLFVADNFPPGNIYEYTSNGVQSIFATLSGGLPSSLVFDSAGNLFVSVSTTNGTIMKIAPDGTQGIFASGLNFPSDLAFQPVPGLRADWTNGTFQVNVLMPSPYYYSTILQVSADLVNWVNIYTNKPPYIFTDSTATTGPRFYRALLGP